MNIRTRLTAALLVLSAGFITAAGAASITLHKQPNFAGAHVTLHDALPNLAAVGFRDQASSLVLNGTWELCSQPNYRGECVVLGPGRYESLPANLNHRIESARPLAEGDASSGRAEQRGSQATLYKQPNFTGGKMPLDDVSTDLARQGFQNQASSAVITGGAWEFCSRPNFRGDCVVLAPGRYKRLDQKIYHRMESARPVGDARVARDPRQQPARQGRERREERVAGREHRAEPPWLERGSVDLYPGPDFKGRPLRVQEDVGNLDGSRMDERVSSFVIHQGTWRLCSQPNFAGQCLDFEPGNYDSMGRMNDRLSSLKQIR